MKPIATSVVLMSLRNGNVHESNSGVAKIFKQGSQSTEGRDSREIFENCCIKMKFLAH